MPVRLLLACYEVPGYGGASTAAYELFRLLQRDGIDASFINFVDAHDIPFYRYTLGENFCNPACLENVHYVALTESFSHPPAELVALIRNISPNVMIGVGWIAALLLKQSSPDRLMFMLAVGSEALKSAIQQKHVEDFLAQERILRRAAAKPYFPDTDEMQAVRLADLILVNSDMLMTLYRYYYWRQAGKIYSKIIWNAEWIYGPALVESHLKHPFAEREIDLLFIASSWSRPEKNYGLTKRISSRLQGKSIHIIGGVEEQLSHVTYHGLIRPGAKVFELMGRAKTVICPSLFDAAPGILFEASAMGCNIVASKNCGNWQICAEELLVDPPDDSRFVEKAALALTHKYKDNMDYFVGAQSYSHLLELLSLGWDATSFRSGFDPGQFEGVTGSNEGS